MVHADHDEPSYWHGARTPPSLNVHRINPISEMEVFSFLDAHQDALQRYLMRDCSDATGFFSQTLAQGDVLPSQAALKNDASTTSDDSAFIGATIGNIDDVASHFAVEANQADGDRDFVPPSGGDDAVVDNEIYPQAGPEANPCDNDSISHVGDEDVAGHIESPNGEEDEASPPAGPEVPSNNKDDSENDDDDDKGGDDNDNKNDAPIAATYTATNTAEVDANLIPYPAPAHLVAQSRTQEPGRGWRLWEQESCIRHMLDINKEGQLAGEARFTEALRRMRQYDNSARTGPSVVKNFWNRIGRARSGFDERRNKNSPLATSKQGKYAKDTKTTSITSSRASKQRKASKLSRTTTSRINTKRRKLERTDPDEEDEESDFVTGNGDDKPGHTAPLAREKILRATTTNIKVQPRQYEMQW
jgi:hypothetical protein